MRCARPCVVWRSTPPRSRALDRYPRFAAYVLQHQERLSARYVAKRSGDGWYRTIDRIDPKLTRTPKLR